MINRLIPFKIVLYLILSAMLTTMLTGCLNYNDPEVVAVAYVDAVYANKVEDFKKLVEEKDYDSSDDYQLFTQEKSTGRLLTRSTRGGISKTEVVSSNLTRQKAYIEVKVTFGNKQVKNLNITLHQSDGRWYVDPMSWATW